MRIKMHSLNAANEKRLIAGRSFSRSLAARHGHALVVQAPEVSGALPRWRADIQPRLDRSRVRGWTRGARRRLTSQGRGQAVEGARCRQVRRISL